MKRTKKEIQQDMADVIQQYKEKKISSKEALARKHELEAELKKAKR